MGSVVPPSFDEWLVNMLISGERKQIPNDSPYSMHTVIFVDVETVELSVLVSSNGGL